MPFNPRPYQSECRDSLNVLMKSKLCELGLLDISGLSFDEDSFDDPERLVRSVMVASCPASGKGDLLAWLAYLSWDKGGTVLIWIHRVELCEDIGERIHEKFGVPKSEIGYIMSGVKENRRCRIQIASVMTKIRRDTEWCSPGLVLTDECHRILSDSQRSLLLRVPNARLVGFTGTPYKTSSSKKEGFEKVFDCLIQLTTYSELVNQRFLLPSMVYVPADGANTDGVKIRMGDFIQSELEAAYMEERLYGSLYMEWKRITGGRMPTMIFNVSQKHNKAVNDFFKKMGVNSVAVDDKTPKRERKKILEKFKKGLNVENPIMVLNSIMLFTEGTDAPACKVAILNYKTLSPIKYFQSAMRAGRPMWNSDNTDWLRVDSGAYYKDKVIIIDLGGNTLRHGMIDTYDLMGFSIKGEKKEGVAPVKECHECRRVIFASYQKCPHCNYVFPVDKKKDDKKFLDEVGLKELNGDQPLMAKIIKMKAKEAGQVETQWLRIVALIRRESDAWVWKQLEPRGEYKQEGVFEWGNKPGSWKEYLENLEKEKGTYSIYERIKSKRLSI